MNEFELLVKLETLIKHEADMTSNAAQDISSTINELKERLHVTREDFHKQLEEIQQRLREADALTEIIYLVHKRTGVANESYLNHFQRKTIADFFAGIIEEYRSERLKNLSEQAQKHKGSTTSAPSPDGIPF